MRSLAIEAAMCFLLKGFIFETPIPIWKPVFEAVGMNNP